jgi:hypothetical protein
MKYATLLVGLANSFSAVIPAFTFLAELLHLGRSLLQQRQLVLSVLLGAEPATRIRMAWN